MVYNVTAQGLGMSIAKLVLFVFDETVVSIDIVLLLFFKGTCFVTRVLLKVDNVVVGIIGKSEKNNS